MGTYDLVRIVMQMMHETFVTYALAIGIVALPSILWGSIVAVAQEYRSGVSHIPRSITPAARCWGLPSQAPP